MKTIAITACTSIPTIISVHQQLAQLLYLTTNLNQMRPLALVVKLRVAFEKLFKEFLDLTSTVNCAIIASCFHPNFKMRLVSREKKKHCTFFNGTRNGGRTYFGGRKQSAD